MSEDRAGQRSSGNKGKAPAQWTDWKRGNLLRTNVATVVFMVFKHFALTREGHLAANVLGGLILWGILFYGFESCLGSTGSRNANAMFLRLPVAMAANCSSIPAAPANWRASRSTRDQRNALPKQ
jgi:hypothetical protein